MNLLGNIIWFVFGGLIAALLWFLLGILLSITIIGIPLGTQCFKFAGLVLFPFGKEVDINFDKHPIANILWLVFVGWEMALRIPWCSTFFHDYHHRYTLWNSVA
jgi:uncharacterized membrane protein YccF (DUF307 family)